MRSAETCKVDWLGSTFFRKKNIFTQFILYKVMLSEKAFQKNSIKVGFKLN